MNEVIELFDYNSWANRRTFNVISKLSAEKFQKSMISSFPSVRETLVHILSAEWVWLSRWKGVSPSGFPTEWNALSFNELEAVWLRNNGELTTFVASLTEADKERVIHYKSIKGDPFSNKLIQLLRHVVNHSTYHRGQITTLLRQLNAETASTDLVVYYREILGKQ